MTVRLSWRSINGGSIQEDGFRIYRDTEPFTPLLLPAILATVAGDIETYDDDTAVPGTAYYYMVEAFKDGVSKFTAVLTNATDFYLLWDQFDELAPVNRAALEDGFLLKIE